MEFEQNWRGPFFNPDMAIPPSPHSRITNNTSCTQNGRIVELCLLREAAAMEETQEHDDDRESKASHRLAEGRERLEQMQLRSMKEFHKSQRDLQSQMELFKWMEEQQESWQREREAWQREREAWEREREASEREREASQRERKSTESELGKSRLQVTQLQADLDRRSAESESTESELRKLRLQVTQLQADLDRRSAESEPTESELRKLVMQLQADLKRHLAKTELNLNGSRQVLAPITPEALRARTPFMKGVRGDGKENDGEEVDRLRQERDQWKEKAKRVTKLFKGLQSQYHSVVGLKGSGGQLATNYEQLQDALEKGLEKPPKIRRRSAADTPTQSRDSRSASPVSSDLNAPNSPAADFRFLPPQPVAGPTPSTPRIHAEVEAEPVHPESSKATVPVPSTKKKAGGLDRVPEGEPVEAIGTPAAVTYSRKRTLDASGKQPSKPPPFKFVEPVRKKADRENLQATECKLCKRFHDAVAAGSAEGLVEPRCNHLERSRHRFRDLPPETPEGFWNIGFDSQF